MYFENMIISNIYRKLKIRRSFSFSNFFFNKNYHAYHGKKESSSIKANERIISVIEKVKKCRIIGKLINDFTESIPKPLKLERNQRSIKKLKKLYFER